MQALVIDAFAFSQQQEHLEGRLQIAELSRLSEELATPAGELVWSLVGGKDQLGHPRLIVSVGGVVSLICQRCLTPMPFEIDSESVLILAKDEESADEIDALLDDDEIDVVVGSKTFNVIELIEDEALLAIPQSPKHELCPESTIPQDSAIDLDAPQEQTKKESPFAVLKKLKS
jgi:uncharacterized protein